MEQQDWNALTDEALLAEKKKLQSAKMLHAGLIGFLAGVLVVGFGAWILSPQKKVGFLIPMAFPVIFIYKMVKNSAKNKTLEAVLKERKLK